jgi:uncharacterized membrane protein YGL010W
LVFYGSYHNNKINQLIHIIFVPLILWTALVWLSYTPQFIPLNFLTDKLNNPFLTKALIGNVSFIMWALYALYYMSVAGLVGFCFNIFMFGLYLTANYYHSVSPSNAWIIATILHIVSWYMQIHPGHLIFEGRKPALTDSFFQSLVLAPLFVFYEVLFTLGFQKKIHAQIQPRIEANIKQYKNEAKKTS